MKIIHSALLVLLSASVAFPVFAKKKKNQRLSEGTITAVENGDLMCYLTVKDSKGKTHTSIGAAFEICADAPKILNKKVKLFYEKSSVNDCESAEPCGKSKAVFLVHKVAPLKK